ncbi:4-alpha-glucanotransferase [Mariprofundus ferrooxydans]|uniref:4-alpha-glucanotransferase n=1 Tax=Mariprofundus ferrooxydans PV-1 TaxID=314345 RepID=Q0F259_9PROT|nr:4-alpha-glucanotransferase [Mariprofundus ferrooxydans]EAU55691.1 4-alpha-glucanotransferase [Mariprofundus ferrooxydans PV-1]KON48583.1 4-alpha-glucanotransferase [Mariprofundus ferrooxydans]
MVTWIDRRKSAVLLHITSLPGPFHKGVLGKEAFAFIDAIAAAGFSVWQFLPLGPTHGHGSPYESLSSFAGNPELLDLREFTSKGWLDETDLDDELTAERHAELRTKASLNFWQQAAADTQLQQDVQAFCQQHSSWLEDYSLFSTLKSILADRAWWHWPQTLRDQDTEALATTRACNTVRIQQVIFEQFMFDCQWKAIKSYAEVSGIELFGDLPIYVAHDSADVWAAKQMFTVSDIGLCDEVAGVPPDYFSATGQRWGNPLYRWDKMVEDHFAWWVERVRHQMERMHLLRIDHFRGLEAYWAIPGESGDGIIGEWRKAPGRALLETLQQQLGALPLVAEDLGIITDEVTTLRKDFGLPGMKILQFAFGGDDHNPYLPCNHDVDSVVYTGTHDNDTTVGWFNHADEHIRQHALQVLDTRPADIAWAMIEAALASPAMLAVIPMQDLLELDSDAKFNTPGTLENNWCWRLDSIPDAENGCWQKAARLNRKYDRSTD